MLTNCYSSKPIRRPQLKKVLKEYCAPIPEENEDPTPPELLSESAPTNTTIVMVNGGVQSGQTNTKGDVRSIDEVARGREPAQTSKEVHRSESPVSPFSST